MKIKGINLILIQIDEAHSSDAWPIGLTDVPESHKNLDERIKRANDFVLIDTPPFEVYIDMWTNDFAECYHSWPDKYLCIDNNLDIIAMSEYGKKSDALINVDCVVLIKQLMTD